MPEGKKKVYRLFRVAKELNVGSSTLVEHLASKGFEIANSPNTKLDGEMYGVLLKEFSSEKVLKQKAEQLREQKREAKIVTTGKTQEESVPEEDEIIPPDLLKKGILDKSGSGSFKRPEAKTETPEPPKVEEKPPVEPPKEEPEEKVGGLKVLDKIDLSQFDKKRPKKKTKAPEPVKEEKPKPPVSEKPKEEKAAPTPEPKVEKVEKKEEPVTPPPVVEKKEPVKEPEVKAPVAKEKPKVEKPKEEKAPKSEKKPEQPKEKEEDQEKTEAEEPEKVIRASDNTPKLRGLKVLRKIELPSDRKKKGKSDDKKSDGKSLSAEEEEKKKKRRKRKRKRTKQVDTTKKTGQRSGGGGNRRGGGPGDRKKKEEMSDKEISEIIKSTLADMQKGAGRNRQRLRRAKRDEDARRRETEMKKKMEEALVLEVTEFITANDLAEQMKVPVTEIITKCLELGLFVSINQRLEADVISLLAEEYGFEVKFVDVTETEVEEEEEEDAPEDLLPRSPIVTVMGHVDHGKTSLLDYVRKANVIAGEAGGITQHIGAYNVTLEDGRQVCFLDTPGHEAFTAMRARGAKVTDIVIVVVAADDSVMPQTKEAINHAEAAGVPIVFALNKVDKDTANPDNIRQQLAGMNYLVEGWGGKFQDQEISAKAGTGIEDLLDKVLLEAEMLELKANPDKQARGTVIEARLDKGRGVVATLLIQEGTLKVGDSMVAGVHYGRIKAMMDERGKRIKESGPSTPVQILGLSEAPQAGDRFVVYPEDRKAKEVSQKRQELYREQKLRKAPHLTLDEISRRKKIGDFQELNLIVKGDVDGSIEALSDSLIKLSIDEIKVNVIMKGVGGISESDVMLASASDAVIIGFQVRPSSTARKLAENELIDIRLYSVIYDAINDVKDALEGMLSPEIKEEILGSAEIRDIFKISKVGTIAGCMVVDGKVTRNNPIRLIRDGIVVYTGRLSSLKRFKDDVKEVARGYECGMSIDNFNDIKVGDIIEAYEQVEEKRTLK